MHLFWKYLKPYRWKILFAMLLAGTAQVLALYDPIIFGKILDNYALKPLGSTLPSGILRLLLMAVGIALGALLFQSLKDYVLRMIVQRFGMDILTKDCDTPYGCHSGIRRPVQWRNSCRVIKSAERHRKVHYSIYKRIVLFNRRHRILVVVRDDEALGTNTRLFCRFYSCWEASRAC